MRQRGLNAIERSRKLRRSMTLPERALWYQFRAHRLGFHVKRQHCVDNYYLDFYVHAAKLCIEIDGSQHADERDYDQSRDERLRELGIETVRISAASVLKDAASAARWLYRKMWERSGQDPLGWFIDEPLSCGPGSAPPP